MVNSVLPNDNTDLIVCLQGRTNKALEYIINYIWANRVPDSLQVGICFSYSLVVINYVCLCCLPPYTNLLLLNVPIIMPALDWPIMLL